MFYPILLSIFITAIFVIEYCVKINLPYRGVMYNLKQNKNEIKSRPSGIKKAMLKASELLRIKKAVTNSTVDI